MKMKDLKNSSYASQQIFIPPALPGVLRGYAKAAIRTQPYDLLSWSVSYFKALAEGRVPPVKIRLEYPMIKSKGGLTLGYLNVLVHQFSNLPEIDKEVLVTRWDEVCLEMDELKQILCLAGVYNDMTVPLYKFAGIAAALLTKSLTQTMITLCELYTKEPDGGCAAIPAELFIQLYTFLAPIDASEENTYVDGNKHFYNRGESTVSEKNISPENIKENLKRGLENVKSISNAQIQSDGQKSANILKISLDIPIKSDSEDGIDDNEPLDGANGINMTESESVDTNKENERHLEEKQFSKDGDTISSKSDTVITQPEDAIPKDESPKMDDLNQSDKSLDSIKLSLDIPFKSDSEDGNNNLEKKSLNGDNESIISNDKQSSKESDDARYSVSSKIIVKEQQELIQELLKTKEEKIKEMEVWAGSLGELAEKSKIINENAEKICKINSKDDLFASILQGDKKEIDMQLKKMGSLSSITSQQVDPNAKGVVNPIFKGLFDNVATKMSAVNAFHDQVDAAQHDIVIVPPVPGIGPAVDDGLVEEFLKYVKESADDQGGLFMPRDIRHCFCPPLEKL